MALVRRSRTVHWDHASRYRCSNKRWMESKCADQCLMVNNLILVRVWALDRRSAAEQRQVKNVLPS